MDDKCPLSGHSATVTSLQNMIGKYVECPACGRFQIAVGAEFRLKDSNSPYLGQEYVLSAVTRRSSDRSTPLTITESNIGELLSTIVAPSDPQEVLDRALLHVASRVATFYATVEVDPNMDCPVACAKNAADLEYALRDGANLGFIVKSAREIHLTSKGWERVNEVRSKRTESDQAFVAMWLDPKLDPIWQGGFKPALEEVGFHPVRISEQQFNEKIDDRIVAEIRRSGLVVADVTGHRGGVYFEAGFALGLGLPLIWTCRSDDIKTAHFDTRQYNHILWETAEDLRQKLVCRIEATLPGRARLTTPSPRS